MCTGRCVLIFLNWGDEAFSQSFAPKYKIGVVIVKLLKMTALSHSHVLTNSRYYPTQCENVLNMTPYNVLFFPNLFLW